MLAEADMLDLTVIFACFACIIVFLYYFKKSSLPPGPTGWPVLGNTLQLDPSGPHKTLAKWAKQFHDVFSIKLLGRWIVVANTESAIREVLVQRSTDFAGRPREHMFRQYICTKNGNDVFISDYSPQWVKLKRTFLQAAKVYGNEQNMLEDIMGDILKDLVEEIKDSKELSFDPDNCIQRALANTLFLMLFAKKFERNEEEFQELLHWVWEGSIVMSPCPEGILLDAFPWIRFLNGSFYKRVTEFIKGFCDGWLYEQCMKRKNLCNIENPECVYDRFLAQQKTESDPTCPLKDDHLVMMCMDFILAGMQTSFVAVYSLLAILTAHPDIQRQAQQEIDGTIGKQTPCVDDAEKMPYVQSMLLELLRYIAHVPLSMPHKAIVDTQLAGHHIPKGTEVWTNLWCLFHDEAIWVEPWTFKPDRFLAYDGSLLPVDHPLRQRLMAFGAGRRVCPAELLARHRMFLIVTSLLQNFTFESAGELPVYDPHTYVPSVVLRPKPYQIRAMNRA